MTLSVLVEHVIVFLRKNMVKLDHSSHWLGYFWSFNASTRAPSFQMLFIMSSSVLTIQGTWNCSSMKGGSLYQLYRPWNILSLSTGAKLVICMRVRSNLQRSLPVRCLGTFVRFSWQIYSPLVLLTYDPPAPVCTEPSGWEIFQQRRATWRWSAGDICHCPRSSGSSACRVSKSISSPVNIKLQLFLKGESLTQIWDLDIKVVLSCQMSSCLYLKLWMAV